MSVRVRECDPDVTVECDCCEDEIGDGKVFCAECANRQEEEKERCAKCRQWFARREMFSKTIGVLCHHCAFLYEMELMEQKKTA